MKTALYDEVVQDILYVAGTQQKHPAELQVQEYLSNGRFSSAVLMQLGGYRRIIQDQFADPDHSTAIVRGQAHRRAQVAKLEKIAGDKDYFTDKVVSAICATLKQNPVPLTKIKPKPFKKQGKRRENVGFLSDTHFGLRVDPAEVPGNDYTWLTASRRIGKYVEQLAAYKHDDRSDCPQLRLCLGGDLCQGVIHLSEHGTDLVTTQLHGAYWILLQAIDYLRHFYNKVIVECTPDNHMRMVHKGTHDRASAQKWDSYATLLHLQLQAAFREAGNVEFHIVKTPYTEFDVLGHRVFMTHGDTVTRSGNIGKSVPIEKITNQVLRLMADHTGPRIKAVMLGHVHVPLNTTLDNGVELIINGTGSGTDAYAGSLGIRNNNPCQVIYEATADYVVGDFRKVYLRDADTDTRYDKIIVPYTGELNNPPRR